MTTGLVDLEFGVQGKDVQVLLEQIDSALSPLGLGAFMFGPVQHWIKGRAQQRFAQEGDSASGKWLPLEQSTIEIREAFGFPPGPINRRTGELEEYITRSEGDVEAFPGMATYNYPGEEPRGHLRRKVETAQKGKLPRQGTKPTPPRKVLALDERDLAFVMTSLAFHVQTYRGGRV